MEINRIIKDYRIILASASPRRRELLKQVGLTFEVITSECEEQITGTSPEQIVTELSGQKAMDVGGKLFAEASQAGPVHKDQPEAVWLVIGADTIVAYGDRILGKPKDAEDAFRMLKLLQGKKHQVYTGVTLLTGSRKHSFYERTDVEVHPMTEEEIREYIATGEPMDKAGAYGIQGRFAAYVKGIVGDYQNVVGLPVARLLHEIAALKDKPLSAITEAERAESASDKENKAGSSTGNRAKGSGIRLVASDIDGTLVKDSSPVVDPEIPELFHELSKRGIHCCVASGRQYDSIRTMFSAVEDEIIYIAENGAHIVYRGQELSVTEMRPEEAAGIIQKLRTYGEGYDIVVSTPEGSLIESRDERFISLIRDQYHNKMRVVEDVLAGNPRIIKIAVRHEGSIREIGENELIPAWKDRVKVCMAGEEWVDFMDSSVDKGNGIRFLQDYFKILREETMAFGDNENDIGLMEAAGESYAVENAREPVKQAARYVCPDYTNHGVALVLKKLLLQSEYSEHI